MERFRALWNQAMQRPWIAKCWQFVKFGIVGVSNTLISLAVYQIALNALGMHYLAANLLGLVISVITEGSDGSAGGKAVNIAGEILDSYYS